MRWVAWASIGAALVAAAGTAGAQPDRAVPTERDEEDPAAEAVPEGAPPPDYYTEPPEPAAEPEQQAPPRPATAQPSTARRAPAQHGAYEPPPPGAAYYPVYEPPPPPKPRHVAPKTAFWAGARVGWFVPFGGAWAECTVVDVSGYCLRYDSIPLRDYVSSGPMFELDVGARLGRRYNLLFAWEHAELGGGTDHPDRLPTTEPSSVASSRGDTDFYALGMRFSSDPDRVGFLTEFALGYRRLRARWDDDTELRLTDGWFEFRLALGADIRLSPNFALSPLASIGFGSFGDGQWVDSTGAGEDVWVDARDAHGWLTIQLGGHFDLGE